MASPEGHLTWRLKCRARIAVLKAVADGLLARPDRCEQCGSEGKPYRNGAHPIQAHHCDYNKPLEVMWLCRPCHYEWHRLNEAATLPPVTVSLSGSTSETGPDLEGSAASPQPPPGTG